MFKYLSVFMLTVACLGATTGAVRAEQASDAVVLLKSGKTTVTKTDVDRSIERIPEEDRAAFMTSARRMRQLLDTIYYVKAAAADARANDLDKSPEIQARIEDAVNGVLAQAEIERRIASVKEPNFEEAADEYYKAHQDQYKQAEHLLAAHILISTQERSKEEALARAKKVRALASEGRNFGELAREYSDDPASAQRGGWLRPFPRGGMVKPFDDAAFAMKPGEISDIVESQFGYHIIYLKDRIPGGVAPFDAVKDKIIAQLRKDFRKQVQEDYLVQLRDAPDIQVNEEAIQSLVVPISSLPVKEKEPKN